jgi:hypothetical protein
MWAMKPSDKHELDAYRASGLTPEQVMQLASQANGDMAPIPFADHVVEYDGEWYGITGIPGLLEEAE